MVTVNAINPHLLGTGLNDVGDRLTVLCGFSLAAIGGLLSMLFAITRFVLRG